jgi:hypothetical protein
MSMIRTETLTDALDSLGLTAQRTLSPASPTVQLMFVRLPFGDPVDYREAWALVRLLRTGHPMTRSTLERARKDAYPQ